MHFMIRTFFLHGRVGIQYGGTRKSMKNVFPFFLPNIFSRYEKKYERGIDNLKKIIHQMIIWSELVKLCNGHYIYIIKTK